MRSFSISLKNDRITMISLASGYHISRSLDALPQDSALQLLNIFPPSKSEKLEVKRIVDIAQDSPLYLWFCLERSEEMHDNANDLDYLGEVPSLSSIF